MKILIIEDNKYNSYLLSYVLKLNGFDVCEIDTGNKGIEAAKELLPDFILLDLKLPDIDGFDIIQRLNQIPETQHIPIIVITASNSIKYKNKATKLGVKGYYKKPINPLSLTNYLKKLKPRLEMDYE